MDIILEGSDPNVQCPVDRYPEELNCSKVTYETDALSHLMAQMLAPRNGQGIHVEDSLQQLLVV